MQIFDNDKLLLCSGQCGIISVITIETHIPVDSTNHSYTVSKFVALCLFSGQNLNCNIVECLLVNL